MKKIIALAVAAVFALPMFALEIKVGDTVSYLPTKEGKAASSVVTKIAPAANGSYELVLLADGVSYTYAVSDGAELNLWGKSTPKAKVATSRKVNVLKVSNNKIEVEAAEADPDTIDAK